MKEGQKLLQKFFMCGFIYLCLNNMVFSQTIVNPGFEDDQAGIISIPAGWDGATNGTFKIDNVYKYKGNKSLNLTGNDTPEGCIIDAVISQTINNVEPGDYLLGVWFTCFADSEAIVTLTANNRTAIITTKQAYNRWSHHHVLVRVNNSESVSFSFHYQGTDPKTISQRGLLVDTFELIKCSGNIMNPGFEDEDPEGYMGDNSNHGLTNWWRFSGHSSCLIPSVCEYQDPSAIPYASEGHYIARWDIGSKPESLSLSQTIGGIKNSNYILSLWFATGVPENDTFSLNLDNGTQKIVKSFRSGLGWAEYQKISVPVSVVDNFLDLNLKIDATANAGSIWIDNWEIKETTGKPIINPGFESDTAGVITVPGGWEGNTTGNFTLIDWYQHGPEGNCLNMGGGQEIPEPLTAYISQTVTDLDKGDYLVGVWISSVSDYSSWTLTANGRSSEITLPPTGLMSHWVHHHVLGRVSEDGILNIVLSVVSANPHQTFGKFCVDSFELVHCEGTIRNASYEEGADGYVDGMAREEYGRGLAHWWRMTEHHNFRVPAIREDGNAKDGKWFGEWYAGWTQDYPINHSTGQTIGGLENGDYYLSFWFATGNNSHHTLKLEIRNGVDSVIEDNIVSTLGWGEYQQKTVQVSVVDGFLDIQLEIESSGQSSVWIDKWELTKL